MRHHDHAAIGAQMLLKDAVSQKGKDGCGHAQILVLRHGVAGLCGDQLIQATSWRTSLTALYIASSRRKPSHLAKLVAI